MKRFGDFLFIGEEDLKKKDGEESDKEGRVTKAKEILAKAKQVKKEKLAGPNEFANDPKNEAANVKKYDEMVAASTSPGGGGATGKSLDQSQKKMGKDDKPHKKDSPEDKAHDVVEGKEKVSDAVDQVKGDPKKMFEHLRSYREMQAEGKGDEWKRSPDNAKMGKSGVSDPMLMSKKPEEPAKHPKPMAPAKEKAPKQEHPKPVSIKDQAPKEKGPDSYGSHLASLNQMRKQEMDKRCWEGYEPTPGKKPYEKGSCQPAKKAMDKNDPAVSGTKVESQQSGEIGNRSKSKDDLLSPLQSEPKEMIAEPIGDKYAKASSVKKSMKEGGGIEWTEGDLMKGLAFSAGAKVGATEGPNLAAKPIVKKDK